MEGGGALTHDFTVLNPMNIIYHTKKRASKLFKLRRVFEILAISMGKSVY